MSGIKTKHYVRKPIHVEAVRVTAENFEAIAEWCHGEILHEGADHVKAPGVKFIRIQTHNPKNTRQTKAFVGDWILRSDRGYKIYTNKNFLLAFEEPDIENVVQTYQEILENNRSEGLIS